MSEKYKIYDSQQLYFVSFATVSWIDVFTQRLYHDILVDSLRYCQQRKGLEIYAWCLMTNHAHLIHPQQRIGKPLRYSARFEEAHG